MADEKIGLEIGATIKADEKQAAAEGKKAAKAFEEGAEKVYKRSQVLGRRYASSGGSGGRVLGQRYVSKGGPGTPGVEAQLKDLAKGFSDNVKEIFSDLKNGRLEKTANNGFGQHYALERNSRERSQEAELYGARPKLKDLLDTTLEFKDTLFDGFFKGSILEGTGKKLSGLITGSKNSTEALAAAIDRAASSEERLKNNAEGTASATKKLDHSKFVDLLLHGTTVAEKNAAIATTQERMRSLEPTAEDYRLAAIRLNVGYHPDEERKQVRASREKIKQYNAEIKTLEKLKKMEDARTGKLFSNKLKIGFSKRFGIFSDKNSIFDKKTIKDNGLLSFAGFKTLRLAEIGFTGLSGAMKTLGRTALKPLLSPMTRLSKWIKDVGKRLRSQVIRTIARSIISLAKEGLKNLQDYSKNLGTPFNDNIKRLSASLNYLKNAFAAMVAPVINYVTPALERLMDTIAMLANRVGAFFAALTGQTQFSAALKKTVSDATSAAGKMKDLFGFDDLNRLSGDSGGGSNLDYAFEEWDPDSGIFGKIKALVDNNQWEELGAQLAGKLNGLVSGFDAEGLGSKIAGKINTGVSLAKGFITAANFTAIGEKIAGFVNGIMNINTEDIALTLTGAITGLFDIGVGFLSKLNWSSVGSAIGGFIRGSLTGFTSWLSNKDWAQIGKDLVDDIVAMIKGFDIAKTAEALWGFIKGVVKALGNLVIGIAQELWNVLVAPVIERIVNLIPDAVWEKLSPNLLKADFINGLYLKVGVKTDDKSFTNTEKKVAEESGAIQKKFTPNLQVKPEWNQTAASNTKKSAEGFYDTAKGIFKESIKATTTLSNGSAFIGAVKTVWEAGKKLFGKSYETDVEITEKSKAATLTKADTIKEKLSGKFKNGIQISTTVKEPSNVEKVRTSTQKTLDGKPAVGFKSTVKDPTNTGSVRDTTQSKVSKLSDIGYKTSLKDASNASKVRTTAQTTVDKLSSIGYNTSAKAIGNTSSVQSAAQTAAGKLTPIYYSAVVKALSNMSTVRDSAQASVQKLSPISFLTAIATGNLPTALAAAWEILQRGLYSNPLQIPTAVVTGTTQQTFAGKAHLQSLRMASGGIIPNRGQIIQVNESGPEVVANLGRSTGVMNVNQMQEAVAAGNIDVVNAVYAMASMIVNAVNAKDLDVYMDSAKVGQSVTNYQTNQMRRGVAY